MRSIKSKKIQRLRNKNKLKPPKPLLRPKKLSFKLIKLKHSSVSRMKSDKKMKIRALLKSKLIKKEIKLNQFQ